MADLQRVADQRIAARHHHGGETITDLCKSTGRSAGDIGVLCRFYCKNATIHVWQSMVGGG